MSPVGKMGSSFSTASLLTGGRQTEEKQEGGKEPLGGRPGNSQEETGGGLDSGCPREMGEGNGVMYGDGGG